MARDKSEVPRPLTPFDFSTACRDDAGMVVGSAGRFGMGSVSRRARVAGLAAIAALISLPFTPALGVLAAAGPTTVASTTSWSGLAADPKSGCKPDKNGDHPNNDNDKK